ncbi:hypothetical protein ATANTOWER_023125 [Ataeniobius toweri]|uniref:Uncharacterized protein n=1 Tax=Ataeniobius toweri TaxID=208326 RepID=A0ABU7C9S5_9TELE|nr:hypothetical protein [Ataeniobius toweri]
MLQAGRSDSHDSRGLDSRCSGARSAHVALSTTSHHCGRIRDSSAEEQTAGTLHSSLVPAPRNHRGDFIT